MNTANNLSPRENEDVPQDATVQSNASQNDQTNDQQVDPVKNMENLAVANSSQTQVSNTVVKNNTDISMQNNTQTQITTNKTVETTSNQTNDTTWSSNDAASDTTWSSNDSTSDTAWSSNEQTNETTENSNVKAVIIDKTTASSDKAIMDKAVDDKAAMMDKAADNKATMMDKAANDKAAMMDKATTTEQRKFDLRSVFLSSKDVKGKKKRISDNLQKRYKSEKLQIARPNALLGNQLPVKRFLGSGGDLVDIGDFAGKKIVLIVLRGFAGGICLACSAQTLALSKSVDKFNEKNAQIILVYPGKAESIPVFTSVLEALEEDFNAPFPIVLDVELELIRQLTIEGSLAKPTSMIVTADGKIEYAYVGKNITDRPTVSTLLLELDKLSQR